MGVRIIGSSIGSHGMRRLPDTWNHREHRATANTMKTFSPGNCISWVNRGLRFAPLKTASGARILQQIGICLTAWDGASHS